MTRTAYFNTCNNPDEVKALYHKLAMQYHPDRGGDTATMQDINAQYTEALKGFDGFTQKSETSEYPRTYKYNDAVEREVMSKIDELIRSHLPNNVTIELLGTWIWISGTTREDQYTRTMLKNAKCRWHSGRSKWYWRPAGWVSHYNKNVDFEDLRSYYSAEEIEHERPDFAQVGK